MRTNLIKPKTDSSKKAVTSLIYNGVKYIVE